MSDKEPRPKDTLRKRTVSAALWALLGRFAQSGLKLVGIIVLSRLLAPSDFGVLALAALFTYAHFTLLDGLIEYPILRAEDVSLEHIRSMIWGALLVSVLLGLSLFVLAPVIEWVFGLEGFAAVLRVCVICFPLQVFETVSRALLRRENRFRDVTIVFAGTALAYVLAGVILALLGLGYWALIGALVAHCITASWLGLALARPPLVPPRRLELSWAKSVGLRGALSKLLFFGWEKIDTLIVGLMMPVAAVGIYTRSYNLSTTMREVFGAVDHPLRQTLVGVRKAGGSGTLAALKIVRLLAFLSSLVAAVLIMLGHEVVTVLLGAHWGAVTVPFMVFVAGLPARVVLQFWESSVLVSGDLRAVVWRQAGLLLLIGLGVWLAAPHGLSLVAAVVTGSIYVSLFLPNPRKSVAIETRALLAAMGPGLALGAGLVLIWFLGVAPFLTSSILSVVCAVAMTLSAGVVALALAPKTWLFGFMDRARSRMLRLGREVRV